MAFPPGHVPYQVGAPSTRLCVQRGMATVSKDGARVEGYDWDALYAMWLGSPTASLIDFGRMWGIPYRVLRGNARASKFRSRTKARMLQAQNATYRHAVLAQATILNVADTDSNVKHLARLLDMLQEGAGVGISYAMQRMAKRNPTGGLVPNMSASAADVTRCMMILARAAYVLRSLGDMRRDTEGEDESPSSKAIPTPVEARRLPGKTV